MTLGTYNPLDPCRSDYDFAITYDPTFLNPSGTLGAWLSGTIAIDVDKGVTRFAFYCERTPEGAYQFTISDTIGHEAEGTCILDSPISQASYNCKPFACTLSGLTHYIGCYPEGTYPNAHVCSPVSFTVTE
jgi:hypothetical protein